MIARSLLSRWSQTPTADLSGRDRSQEADLLAGQLVYNAQEAMRVMTDDGPNAALSLSHTLALESVILSRGRPALRVMEHAIEPIDDERHPGSGFWRTILNDHEHTLAATASAVAAVMVKDHFAPTPETVVGTAWLLGPNLAITNRHVLFPDYGLRLARRQPGNPTQARLKSDVGVSLDFAYDNGPARQLRYAVDAVVFVCEPNDPVDVALLRVKPTAAPPFATPKPLTLNTDASEWEGNFVYAVGHPGRMAQVPSDIAAVFGNPDGRKRVSFGELMDPDPNSAVDLLYDASTIGGYSGGPATPIGSEGVIGLHYWGGDVKSGNRAIIASALRAHALNQFLPA
ncbi:trypsin-like serine peptidase [Lysobacter capsici]|uniref:trypsin-like serine peptidase n=1 Tax=Lysobacter capsici TaxID=435897 RepID=UPI0011DF86D0|nr:serine protease [Lysobacter capsici]